MHKMVTITTDAMFINGISFLGTFLRKIKFRPAEVVPKGTANSLAKHLKKVPMLYARGSFIVNLALMDKEVDALKEHVPFLQINTTAAREHVGEIERKSRTTKERVRCTTRKFPFRYIPTMILIYVVYNVLLWLNVCPIRSGITGEFSRRGWLQG